MNQVALHPVVAGLAGALTQTGGRWGFPATAVSAFRSDAARLSPADKETVFTHVVAFALQCRRSGVNDEALMAGLATLALELVGDANTVTDAFQAVGLNDVARMIGGSTSPLRAPSAPTPTTTPVQARRGLLKS
jgi:hypothetical protein